MKRSHKIVNIISEHRLLAILNPVVSLTYTRQKTIHMRVVIWPSAKMIGRQLVMFTVSVHGEWSARLHTVETQLKELFRVYPLSYRTRQINYLKEKDDTICSGLGAFTVYQDLADHVFFNKIRNIEIPFSHLHDLRTKIILGFLFSSVRNKCMEPFLETSIRCPFGDRIELACISGFAFFEEHMRLLVKTETFPTSNTEMEGLLKVPGNESSNAKNYLNEDYLNKEAVDELAANLEVIERKLQIFAEQLQLLRKDVDAYNEFLARNVVSKSLQGQPTDRGKVVAFPFAK